MSSFPTIRYPEKEGSYERTRQARCHRRRSWRRWRLRRQKVEEAVKLHGRDDWGAVKPTDIDLRRLHDIRAVVFHYADAPAVGLDREDDMCRAIQRHHMHTKGWDDIGYHALGGMSGDIYQGRSIDAIGSHCKGYNTPSIGYCFLTDGGITPEAGAAAVQFVQMLGFAVFHRKLTILTHREKVHTKCPGDKLAEWVEKVRSPGGPLA